MDFNILAALLILVSGAAMAAVTLSQHRSAQQQRIPVRTSRPTAVRRHTRHGS